MNTQPTPAWRSQYPFGSHFLPVGGFNLHYVDEGPGSTSTAESNDHALGPVLMIHGNPTWSFYYRNLILALREHRRCIAVDHIGCGLSDKPADFDYCLQQHIDNVTALVEHLDLSNVTLVAHDWGGSIGLGALLAMKERFKRIVLFNTAAFPPPYIPFRIRVCRWPIVGKIGLQGFNLFAKAAIRMATEQKGGLPSTVAEGLLAPYDSWNNRIATYQFVKDIPLSRSHRTWSVLEGIEKQLPDLSSMPSLLMWGMKDWCFRPECLERFESYWPQAEVHRYEDAGHYVVEDELEKIVPTLQDFLNRNDG